jgi:hypothetical protein
MRPTRYYSRPLYLRTLGPNGALSGYPLRGFFDTSDGVALAVIAALAIGGPILFKLFVRHG